MKKIIMLSVMSAAVFSMSTASAGGGSLFGSSGESSMLNGLGGLYVGGSYGQATARCMLGQGAIDNEDCTTDGWKAFAGYKITDNIAVEGGYYSLGKAEETYQHDSYGTINATGEASGIGLTGIYSYEILDNLELFGKAGAMMWHLEGKASNAYGAAVEEQDGTSLLLGAGANYKLSDNFGIRGEYEQYTAEYEDDLNNPGSTKESDVSVLSAGLTFSTY